MASGMWWKGLVIALLVLPPIAYVAGTLSARVDAPEQRPALVLDDAPPVPARTERQVTLAPRPQPSPRAPAGDDREDDGDDDRDSDDGGVTIVRPPPQEAADDSDGSGDDDDFGGDDSRDDDDGDGDDDGNDD